MITTFRASLQTEQTFEDYLNHYFQNHKVLNGSYETREYFENYKVRMKRNGRLALTTTTCLNIAAAPVPLKQTENITISDFRRLVENKKFADINATLADVFEASLNQ
ncbi:hypothetical protein HMPREF9103_01540 [Lentilactobacillus parafarraginis F0439]|jgi:hypothetical protein|uniref:Uncharacterized protein n=3 Tax=Lentilactobacillus parafarraginis TaxID=390842 RepID=A0A0R1YW26_9LACO|nr:hypothetical protein [Lentilactobacillus parafarraginis]EHL98497.1 hypothetical protein HMPREF9103_01540 [Lentilactobacillus parafarraginis F0439]KRM44724.1 hypothetical protein FD47_GL000180 [Lentilactobacillus parafarraginis DSM 18390 = JCM 14109]